MENLSEWLKPELIWFIVGLVFLLIEFASPGLIIGFFGIGAWMVSGVLLFFDISLTLQLLIFIAASLLLTVLLRKWVKRVFNMESIQNQAEQEPEFVGQKVTVTHSIAPNKTGKVEFKGADWEAEADSEIAVGTVVEIIDRKSIKFIVKPL